MKNSTLFIYVLKKKLVSWKSSRIRNIIVLVKVKEKPRQAPTKAKQHSLWLEVPKQKQVALNDINKSLRGLRDFINIAIPDLINRFTITKKCTNKQQSTKSHHRKTSRLTHSSHNGLKQRILELETFLNNSRIDIALMTECRLTTRDNVIIRGHDCYCTPQLLLLHLKWPKLSY